MSGPSASEDHQLISALRWFWNDDDDEEDGNYDDDDDDDCYC